MRLSRLKRLLSSQIGFFPDVSNDGVDAIKHTFKSCLGLKDGFEHVPTLSYPVLKLREHLRMRFMREIPKYRKIMKLPKLEEGMVLNADSILSVFPLGSELRLHISKSKYIMVCCFLVPLLDDARDTMSLISVTSELRDLYGSDFEMVLVAKMREGWLKHKPSFDHFFSEFPPFCRVIPFSDANTRDHICQLLGFYDSRHAIYLLLERSSQSTDPTYRVLSESSIECFEDHGADHFPYSKQTLTVTYNDEFINFPSQLDLIFGRKCSDICVSRFSPSSSNGGESMSLSELGGKVVGFYLCFNGSLMSKLDQVSRDCRERGLEFEVVLVYMPFYFTCNANTLMEAINDVLSNMCNTRSWWIMPYIDSISRKFWVLSPTCTSAEDNDDDRLIIVGPHGKYVDPYAGVILERYGVDVYPFTCDRLIDWKLEKVRSVTLESLLVYGSRDFVLGKGSNGGLQKVPVSQLYGKVVLVYFEYVWTKDTASGCHGLLAQYYDQIKSAHPNFEAVFVSLSKTSSEDVENVDAAQLPPWLVCPPQADHCKYVYDMLGIDSGRIVAFGEDGRVCSFGAHYLLNVMGVDAFPFNGEDLRQEVISSLAWDNSWWTIPDLG